MVSGTLIVRLRLLLLAYLPHLSESSILRRLYGVSIGCVAVTPRRVRKLALDLGKIYRGSGVDRQRRMEDVPPTTTDFGEISASPSLSIPSSGYSPRAPVLSPEMQYEEAWYTGKLQMSILLPESLGKPQTYQAMAYIAEPISI